VNMSVPLRQRTARGLIAAAQSKLQKLAFDEVAEKQRITAEVDDTVSAINTSVDRFIALGAEVELAAKVESGEKLRFKAGDSTLFLVNQRERTTAEAKVRMIDAHVDFLQALAAFEVVTCRL
jgi:outer membrane protein